MLDWHPRKGPTKQRATNTMSQNTAATASPGASARACTSTNENVKHNRNISATFAGAGSRGRAAGCWGPWPGSGALAGLPEAGGARPQGGPPRGAPRSPAGAPWGREGHRLKPRLEPQKDSRNHFLRPRDTHA